MCVISSAFTRLLGVSVGYVQHDWRSQYWWPLLVPLSVCLFLCYLVDCSVTEFLNSAVACAWKIQSTCMYLSCQVVDTSVLPVVNTHCTCSRVHKGKDYKLNWCVSVQYVTVAWGTFRCQVNAIIWKNHSWVMVLAEMLPLEVVDWYAPQIYDNL